MYTFSCWVKGVEGNEKIRLVINTSSGDSRGADVNLTTTDWTFITQDIDVLDDFNKRPRIYVRTFSDDV